MLKTNWEKMPNMGKQTCYQTKGGCPRRTNVGLGQVSIVPLDWSMDDTQTYAWTCRQVCKEAKKAKWVMQSKQGKHINIAQVGEGCIASTQTPQSYILQVVTPQQTLGGMGVTTKVQTHKGHKAGQSLDLERLTYR